MITPENVLDKTLRQILLEPEDEDVTEENAQDYSITVNYVRGILFSRFPQRREYAQRLLDDFWGTRVRVERMEDGGVIYAYISFGNAEEYALVEKYASRPFLEEAPDAEEMADWCR